MSKRVVITGMGIVSSIGNSCEEVTSALIESRSGIEFVPQWAKLGFKSQVAGTLKLPPIDELRSRFGPKARFMGESALYALLSSEQAIADSGLGESDLKRFNTACIAGSGISNTEPLKMVQERIEGRRRKVSAFEVTRGMSSSVSANLANYYGIKGRSYSISSACASSLHNVGHAFELIKNGKHDLALAGGAEEVSAAITSLFDDMRIVLSSKFNNEPKRASRPYDRDRDGFVISGGAGMVVLEEYERAKRRNAPIYGEIIGFGTSSDGHDIVQPDPSGEGCYHCMMDAFSDGDCDPASVDYVNTHGTATTMGDLSEAVALKKLFKQHPVKISSTKALTGHGIGATGAQELIYALQMMRGGFITASVNIDNRDPAFDDLNIITENSDCEIGTFLTNSFGFGGTNASLIVRKAS